MGGWNTPSPHPGSDADVYWILVPFHMISPKHLNIDLSNMMISRNPEFGSVFLSVLFEPVSPEGRVVGSSNSVEIFRVWGCVAVIGYM